MCHAPRLVQIDTQRKLYVQTNTSNLGLGAVLFRDGDGSEREK